ncbi:hypothetical protein B0H14DRAFT_3577108 [Mycena olivaceomarginata]|nr:hypothetical protein B0H14DRAFT_3577108 [Mycena olivaceomarginata]
MARFSMLLALFAAAAATAAPVQQRALGSLQCNVDRFKIVTTLAATSGAVMNIDTTSQAGLSSAGDGIKAIALALITGGTPPADARDQVKTGLDDAQTALIGITDPTVRVGHGYRVYPRA